MENNTNDFIKKIKELAMTKQLNFLIGSGVSMPAISLMGQVEGANEEEKNNELIKKVSNVSKKLLNDKFDDEKIKITFKNYRSFITKIIFLLNKSNSRQVPRSVNIFTTNYDLFIEKTIDELSIENRIIFNDGSNGYFKKYIDSSNYNKVVSYKGLNDNYINEIPSINLIKPHGSINWKREEERILVCNEVVENPVVVKPTGKEGQETFLNNYFHDMLRMFQIELDKPQSVIFVIGFSFQDKHIAKMFTRALQNPELIAYIFCYKDEEKEKIKKNLNLKEEKNNLKILSPHDLNQYIYGNNEDNQTFTINEFIKLLK